LIRKEAVSIAVEKIGNQHIVSANGFISRDIFEICDKNSNFYMIGSMGLASSIGLGLAIKNTKKKIFVFDGDGNILMNLGSLVTIGMTQPKNLVHVIFDNGSHESTGGQPTATNKIQLNKIAKSVNYKVFQVKTKKQLVKILQKIKLITGPIMIIVKIEKSRVVSTRVNIEPTEIKNRFMDSLKK
jgi:thiamine pyrophosphate-dependent acetolactate synthase large subunit-like protein|tara:strand:- start:1101 stop:1655 length:555 start_codon:yes stop_codon:yes gene_type:complete